MYQLGNKTVFAVGFALLLLTGCTTGFTSKSSSSGDNSKAQSQAASNTLSAVNGSCGSASGSMAQAIPTSNLCSSGTPSIVSGTGPWNWTCNGSSGGTNASCTANLTPAPVNGACGSANGSTQLGAPTSTLCSAGTPSAVSGTGPWNWTCAGTNGGTMASCSATAAPPSCIGNYSVLISWDGAQLANQNLNITSVASNGVFQGTFTVQGLSGFQIGDGAYSVSGTCSSGVFKMQFHDNRLSFVGSYSPGGNMNGGFGAANSLNRSWTATLISQKTQSQMQSTQVCVGSYALQDVQTEPSGNGQTWTYTTTATIAIPSVSIDGTFETTTLFTVTSVETYNGNVTASLTTAGTLVSVKGYCSAGIIAVVVQDGGLGLNSSSADATLVSGFVGSYTSGGNMSLIQNGITPWTGTRQ